MTQLLTVSVGIPALNEESNIRELVESLLSQSQEGFVLQEVIVVSDGSTDRTVNEARKVKSKKLIVLEFKNREGKTVRQNEIIKKAKGDVVVIVDGDTLPKGRLFLKHLVEPFYKIKNLGIVGGKVTPLKSITIFEKIINFSVKMKESIYDELNNGDNIYHCHGRVRAFSKDFLKKFYWEPVKSSEDAYSFLRCKELGYLFHYSSKAEILYRSPQSLSDHLKQSTRFYSHNKSLKNFFADSLIYSEYHIPNPLKVKYTIKYFFLNPIFFISYLTILLLSIFIVKKGKNQTILWSTSDSSKILR